MLNLWSQQPQFRRESVTPLQDGVAQGSEAQAHNRYPESREQIGTTAMGVSDEMKAEVEISAGQKMLSAVSGSLLTSLLVTPLDVVRVRLQSQPTLTSTSSRIVPPAATFSKLPPNLGVTACCREVFWVNNNSSICMAAGSSLSAVNTLAPSSSTASADCAVDQTRRKTFNSTFDGLRKIARHEGLGSLWRGLSPTLVMAVPGNVIYFTGYDYLRFNPSSPINMYISSTYSPLIAGSVARIAAATVVSPIEMFRTRMQAATSGRNGKGVFIETLIGLRNLIHVKGYTSLWRGLTLTMWRDVPFSGLYWWGYEVVRNTLASARNNYPRLRSGSQGSGDHATTFIDSFISGAASGAVAALVTTPFDVGKTRRQVLADSRIMESGKTSVKSVVPLGPEERSMVRFLYHIWLNEGAAGLFRGCTARCLKVAPACAIMISSYEIGKKMAKRINEKKHSSLEG